jgi:S-adenosylmethionine hydrolase
MPIITLTSDYGTVDHRVAAIKGNILQLNPEAKIIDILIKLVLITCYKPHIL